MKPSHYIEKILTDTLGLDLASMGKGFLERTLEGLLKKSGCSSLENYVARLKSSPGEEEKIIEAVVVPETWFFRDHGPFDYLQRYIITHWRQETRTEKIRILSVPCSTGEEPYSIVMTLLTAGMSPEEFVVDAVDLSENALRVARGGLYGKGSFRGMAKEIQSRYFHQEESKLRISQQVVSAVRFYRDNLLRPVSMAQMQFYHVIFCRNLLIYLHTKAKETAFSHIERLLRPGGVLIAGHAEVLFWRQKGYIPADHPRSFALIKSLEKEQTGRLPAPINAPLRGKMHPRREPEREGNSPVVEKTQVVIAPPAMGTDMQSVPIKSEQENDGMEFMIQARSLADRGRMEEALSVCRRYLEEHPPCAQMYCLMGLIHESRDRVGESEECYLKALYLDPDHLETLIHAGLMYARRHDQKKATLLKNRATRIERQRHENAD
ncbi:MAG: hypothetical protein C0394_00405 [Syntrophus sp. (in: bacteria)]|nr:hypothetical protein [Syntrophus sp. (in: bacteria)]